jgi:hypothetical protein
MHRRIILLTGTTATLLAGPLATGAMAQDVSIGEVAAAVNSVWIVVAPRFSSCSPLVCG